MISPSDVFEAAKKKEAKNYKFRAFLKNHANEDELDKQFLKLHNELFSEYDCKLCRNCCKMYHGEVAETDIDNAAQHLKLTQEEFIGKFLTRGEFGMNYVTKHAPCDFYIDNGECMLGEHKPESCKNYPYTNQPGRLWSLLGFIESVGVCPVAYEICERLKKEYGFR